MSEYESSENSIKDASKNTAKKSGHGMGAAGFSTKKGLEAEEKTVVNIEQPENGFGKMEIGLGWNNTIMVQTEGLIARIAKKTKQVGVDLDLGCLYQLKDDTRGCLQGFGELFGHYNKPPFINHSGDERTGDTEGFDERMEINGAQWDQIERIVIYTYIYEGPQQWADIQPEIHLNIPGHKEMTYQLDTFKENIPMYGFVLLENHNGNLRLTEISEYYAGHAEISRAFSFGIRWEEGEKN